MRNAHPCGGRRGRRPCCWPPPAVRGGGGADGGGAAEQKSVGKGEGQVDIIAWAGYAEDGSNDPEADWVHPFEKQTGCKVNIKTAGTSDEMVIADEDRPVRRRLRLRRRHPAADRRGRRGARSTPVSCRTTRTSSAA